MMRALLIAILLSGCTKAPVEPVPCDWCDHLKNDVAVDSLLHYPDSLDPATGRPRDTIP